MANRDGQSMVTQGAGILRKDQGSHVLVIKKAAPIAMTIMSHKLQKSAG